VELENTIEGLVRIESLPQDSYLFFEKSLKLKGNSHTYCLGDKVKIKVIASNVFDRKIDFVLA
jgi:ribonuclease R